MFCYWAAKKGGRGERRRRKGETPGGRKCDFPHERYSPRLKEGDERQLISHGIFPPEKDIWFPTLLWRMPPPNVSSYYDESGSASSLATFAFLFTFRDGKCWSRHCFDLQFFLPSLSSAWCCCFATWNSNFAFFFNVSSLGTTPTARDSPNKKKLLLSNLVKIM